MAIDTVAQLLATAEDPPNIEPLGPPYNSAAGYTCFDGALAIGTVNGNPLDVPNLQYLSGQSGTVINPIPFLQQAQVVTITTAELLALHTTPITVLPNAPAGMTYVLDKCVANLIYNSIAYTGAGSSLELEFYDGTHAEIAQTLSDAILGETVNTVGIFTDVQATNITATPSSYMIAHLVRFVTTKAANYAAGNSPLKLTVFFKLVPLS